MNTAEPNQNQPNTTTASQTPPQRFCKKCLLRDMDENEYFANLHDYMERLDPDLKADAATYEARLGVCQTCDYLNAGMCGACGCFVELRALLTKNVCPYKKW